MLGLLFPCFSSRKKNLIIQLLILIYLGLVAFALFNYCNHCAVTSPRSLMDPANIEVSVRGDCTLDFDKLGVQEVHKYDDPSEESIIAANPNVTRGGKWAPTDCKAWQKVAIILPYRDRVHPLKLLLRRLHPMLQIQKLDYQIFVIEQAGTGQFNRGKLFNVGFMEAIKSQDFDCLIFHDVDLLPEDDRNLYLCDEHGRHLETATDDLRYHLKYYNYAGGVVAINAFNFQRINGFANSYWGWGNEDDDFSARITESGLLLTRPPEIIGRYQMVPHMKNSRSSSGNGMFFGWRRRWQTDGLNDPVGMNYTVVSIEAAPLFTKVTVDIGAPPPDMDVYMKDHSQDISLWWFLSFYYP
ncbi:beta-1,4-galactosyltransferase 4-like [Physella acuta]|uniref:beta-1,4-galactosyltransferase 4-like n=1 Tax=Physella acuta TaxID=109671 RepID=UPI0027DE0395|nr:beta-1,4-galactosyltransferase 4-like [Physella acuta]